MEDIAATRRLTGRPFGVNLFAPPAVPAAPEVVVGNYAETLEGEAIRAGVELGRPRFDDDAFAEKLRLLLADPVAAVSFTFGCPSADIIAAVKSAGCEAWVTVTDVDEAGQAQDAGASVLVVQGSEAGGHRGSFVDRTDLAEYSLLSLLQLIGGRVRVPMVGAGGISTGGALAAVLCAGASAGQLGTVFMRSPEAGTSEAHREALASSRPTATTRAFTGRLARGVVNRFMREHGSNAPLAYPEVHHLTAPLRAYGRREGDADVVNLWAGQTHELAPALPAAEIVARVHGEARQALDQAAARLSRPQQ